MRNSRPFKNTTDFLRGRQTAYMIFDLVRASGADDAAQDLSDLFNVS